MEETTPAKRPPPESPLPHPAHSMDGTPTEGSVDDEDGFTKQLTKSEKKKLRKVEKRKPRFQFDVSSFRTGRKIAINHIRELILFLVSGDVQKPNWVLTEHRSMIDHTVVLLIPGLLPSHIGILDIPVSANMPFPINPLMISTTQTLPTNQVPVLCKMFTYGLPTRAPGDSRRLFSVMGTLLQSPLPDEVRKANEKEARRLAKAATGTNVPPFLYLLTPNQMLANDYPAPSYLSAAGDVPPIPKAAQVGLSREALDLLKPRGAGGVKGEDPDMGMGAVADTPAGTTNGHNGLNEGWVETAEATGPPPTGTWRVLAIDCEMVLTSRGSQLARVSIIDFHSGETVLDEYVKPDDPIVDYRTKWSGITPERLSSATKSLTDIQTTISTGPSPLITPHTILLGHSLNCDLDALKLRHPLCIDTSISFRHPKGASHKHKLKWLTEKWLNRKIQEDEGGHDSAEDARACVDLLKLKLTNGPEFGSYLESNESIFERMARFAPDPSKPGKTSAFCDYSSGRGSLGAKAPTTVHCALDEEVLRAMVENVSSHDFVFGRFMDLSNIQGWNINPNTPLPEAALTKSLDTALQELNTRLTTLHDALPANTAFIILTGNSNPLPMLELGAKRSRWERIIKERGGHADGIEGEERWLAEDDRRLEAAANEAREGMSFFCVK